VKWFSFVAVALTLAPMVRAQAPDVAPIVRAGLDAYKAGNAATALTTWFKGSPVPEQSTLAARGVLEQIESSYGRMVGYDVLQVAALGPHVTRSYIVLLYEKGPLYAWFDCYKTGDQWIMTGFLFNTKPDLILPPNLLGHVTQPSN
jgi:hypothetical protein